MRNLICSLLLIVFVVACGKSSPSAGTAEVGANPPGQNAVTWSAADVQTFTQHCGFGDKGCQCVMKIAQQQGIPFEKYSKDPAIAKDIVMGEAMGKCMQGR